MPSRAEIYLERMWKIFGGGGKGNTNYPGILHEFMLIPGVPIIYGIDFFTLFH